MLSRDEYLAAWSRWHGGTGTDSAAGARLAAARATPSPGRWPGCRRSSRPPLGLARRRPPRSARPPPAGAWLIAAGLLVGLSGLLDSLDGALAIGTGRASRRGFVLDSVVDRLTEVAYAGALWVAGAPGWLAVAFGALCWLPDYLRARAGQAGVAGDRRRSRCGSGPPGWSMTGLTLGGAGVVSGRRAGRRRASVTAERPSGALLGVVAVVQLGCLAAPDARRTGRRGPTPPVRS